MNNFDSSINGIKRPTQSGWYHTKSDVKGQRTPDGGNHYFVFGSNKSLCKKYIKQSSWRMANTYAYNSGHKSICKDCLRLYIIMKNTSNDDVLTSLVTPHHIHSQNCSVCGINCIYLSNNKEHIQQDRIHVGCNGHEVSLVR